MIEKFQNWFHENSITEVECLVPDLGGIARGKILPTNKFLKGLEDESHRLPQSTFIQTISGDYATEDSAGALPRSVYNPTDIDVILKPDFNTMRDEVNSDRYFSGMLLKDSYHLNPLKLTYGLAEQCLANGINIYENSPVDKIVDNQKVANVLTT